MLPWENGVAIAVIVFGLIALGGNFTYRMPKPDWVS